MAKARQDSPLSRLPIGELQAAFGAGVPESPVSSEDEEVPPAPEINGTPTEETARQLLAYEDVLMKVAKRLARRKRRLKAKLVAYQRKEVEFVQQMDSHMDEVERTEQALTQRIEALTADNTQLRSFTDKRARDNGDLSDKLAESTKQCGDSETRVQFLVDRIVALLSNVASSREQTQAITNMRVRERDMLSHLEDARLQYDEVRQQNGELTSRLTEELALSRRLSDQLQEVEERLFHNRSELPLTPNGGADITASLHTRGSRLGSRLGNGLLADEVDGSPDRERSQLAEGCEAMPEALPLGKQSRPLSSLGVVPEGLIADNMDLGDDPDSPGNMPTGGGEEWQPSDAEYHEDTQEDFQPEQQLRSRTAATPEGLMHMEGKLRDALDRASFECAVVRVEPGIYNFGPSVRAVVELDDDGEAIASRDGGPFHPIEEFIRDIGRESAAAEQEQADQARQAAQAVTRAEAADRAERAAAAEPAALADRTAAAAAAQSEWVARQGNVAPRQGDAATQEVDHRLRAAHEGLLSCGGCAAPSGTNSSEGLKGLEERPRPLHHAAYHSQAPMQLPCGTSWPRGSSPCPTSAASAGSSAPSPPRPANAVAARPPQAVGGAMSYPGTAPGAGSQVPQEPIATPTVANAAAGVSTPAVVAAALAQSRAHTPGRAVGVAAAVSQPNIASHQFSPRPLGGAQASGLPWQRVAGGSATLAAGPLVPQGVPGPSLGRAASPLAPSPMRLSVAQAPGHTPRALGWTPTPTQHMHVSR